MKCEVFDGLAKLDEFWNDVDEDIKENGKSLIDMESNAKNIMKGLSLY